MNSLTRVTDIETKIGFCENIDKKEPALRPILRQNKCVVTHVDTSALLKHVSRDADGNTTSPAGELGLILGEIIHTRHTVHTRIKDL